MPEHQSLPRNYCRILRHIVLHASLSAGVQLAASVSASLAVCTCPPPPPKHVHTRARTHSARE